jgi:hypothetical protein
VAELPKLNLEISSFPGFLEVPWFLIFDLLGWKTLKNTEDESITPWDVDALAQCYRIPEIHEIISPTIQYVIDTSDDEYWSQHCNIAGSQWTPQPSPTRPNSLLLLLRDIPLPSTDLERNSPHSSLSISDVLKIAPSISAAASASGSIVNVGTYPKADDFPLRISRDIPASCVE